MIDKDNFDWFIVMAMFFMVLFYSFFVAITVGTNIAFFIAMIVDVVMMVTVSWAGAKLSH